MFANPFTKESHVPPAFMAVRFLASLINTCSSAPSAGLLFFPLLEKRAIIYYVTPAKDFNRYVNCVFPHIFH